MGKLFAAVIIMHVISWIFLIGAVMAMEPGKDGETRALFTGLRFENNIAIQHDYFRPEMPGDHIFLIYTQDKWIELRRTVKGVTYWWNKGYSPPPKQTMTEF